MKVLNREDILAAMDLNREKVEVPEWGGSIFIQCMTGSERDDFENDTYIQKGSNIEYNRKNFRAKLLARTIVSEDGKRLFGDQEIDLLGKKSGKVLDKLLPIALRLNGIGKDAIEELTKN